MWNICTADSEGQVGTANSCFLYQAEEALIIVWAASCCFAVVLAWNFEIRLEMLWWSEMLALFWNRRCLLKKHSLSPRPSFEVKISQLVHGNAARSRSAKGVFIITLMNQRLSESQSLYRGPVWLCSHPAGKLRCVKSLNKLIFYGGSLTSWWKTFRKNLTFNLKPLGRGKRRRGIMSKELFILLKYAI